ncbi:MAG: hypothetical protein GOU98_02040 [Candidatus Altiarchaeota archaeon]|nr:hypothetical protein [Candidatus Altiarchaeota archaeon]
MNTTQVLMGTVVFLVSMFMMFRVFSAIGDKALADSKDLPSDKFINYMKDYDGNLVFEFSYTGELNKGNLELESVPAEDLEVIAIGPDGEKTTYTFNEDIDAMEIIQIDLPDDTVNARLIYKGALVQ